MESHQMKKTRSTLILLILITGMGLSTVIEAQVVRLKREAYSPGRRIGVTGPNYVSTGLRVVAKGMKVYWSADTTGSLTNKVTSYTWSVASAPAGSTATISAVKDSATFIPDATGQYIITCTVDNGKFGNDTIFVSTYMGWPTSPVGCQTSGCHQTQSASYAKTNHATIFMRGITGQLEVDSVGRGAYGKSCVRCHTTGWEPVTNNGNFGYIANETKWDSSWWKNLPVSGSTSLIPWKDMALWNNLKANYPSLLPVATIGCESCHGPGKDHMGDKTKIAVSFDQGVCMQCHDAPKAHSIGYFWKQSKHATRPLSASEASRTGCFPCHNGPSLAALQANSERPDYSKTPFQTAISCQSCHDPHDNTNPAQLRIMRPDTLINGYVIPAGIGGAGNICIVCHRARASANQTVAAVKRVFNDIDPHVGAQGDMFLGTNGYDFGHNKSAVQTHAGLENGCATCHMAPVAMAGSASMRPNHSISMKDENGNDNVTSCRKCHGDINRFDDVRAGNDYDGNGRIEGVTTEIRGILKILTYLLPLDSLGNVLHNKADSARIKAHPKYPNVIGVIWNYYYILNDASFGVHNMKYTVWLLMQCFGHLAGQIDDREVDVEQMDQTPIAFALNQNYPNPLINSTSIEFSISRTAQVNLNVYDATGRLVATLADGLLLPGSYSIRWNAGNVSAGMYFFRMTVIRDGQTLFSSTKKMVVGR